MIAFQIVKIATTIVGPKAAQKLNLFGTRPRFLRHTGCTQGPRLPDTRGVHFASGNAFHVARDQAAMHIVGSGGG